MKLIVCLDNKNGLCFNKRRQSQDRRLRDFINFYTYELYKDFKNAVVCEDFLSRAKADDYCLLETCSVKEDEEKIRELFIFRWNKVYPADTYFDLDLSLWNLAELEELEGSSHSITKERYIKGDYEI